jgi:hypothetical protein
LVEQDNRRRKSCENCKWHNLRCLRSRDSQITNLPLLITNAIHLIPPILILVMTKDIIMSRSIQQFNLLPRPLIRRKLMDNRFFPGTPVQITYVHANLDGAGESEDSDVISVPAKGLETLDAEGGDVVVVGRFEEGAVKVGVEADMGRGEEAEVNDKSGGRFLIAIH